MSDNMGNPQPDYAKITEMETDLGLPHAPTAPRMLTKDDILAVADLPVELVDVPEWGGQVTVRGLSAKGRDEYYASIAVMREGRQIGVDAANASAKLAARCMIDPVTGDVMFNDADVVKLGEKSSAALDRVVVVIERLSGLDEKSVQELGKGSGETRNAGFISS